MKTTINLAVAITGLVALASTSSAQERFKSPEAGVRALAAAAREGSVPRLTQILGPDSEDIVSSGDPVDDEAVRRRFATAVGEKTEIEKADDGATAIAHIGKADWPFPIPLVRDGDGWRFDTAAGKEEVINRRIGRNELTALAVCRAYVDAQREYARRFKVYAQTFRSSPGKQDGLYWETSGSDESPLGPLVAEATAEGYKHAEGDAGPAPYHGYFFRILTSQGKHAPGGARDFVSNGKMTGGFALIAWPADYGASGIMTFMVDSSGVVFQKNLGEGTSEAVKKITAYDPDESWDPTR